jgi:hypothetical protein
MARRSVRGVTLNRPPKLPCRRASKKHVLKLTFSSPSIKRRVENDQYDDCPRDDFGGKLVEYFYTGDDMDFLRQAGKQARGKQASKQAGNQLEGRQALTDYCTRTQGSCERQTAEDWVGKGALAAVIKHNATLKGYSIAYGAGSSELPHHRTTSLVLFW